MIYLPCEIDQSNMLYNTKNNFATSVALYIVIFSLCTYPNHQYNPIPYPHIAFQISFIYLDKENIFTTKGVFLLSTRLDPL